MGSAGARPTTEGGGHRRCAGVATEPATSPRCQSADDCCDGRTEGATSGGGRRPAPDRGLARVLGRRLLRTVGGRAVGSTPWQQIVATLAVIAALHLPAAHGQPRYMELDENPEWSNNGVTLRTLGTPPDNHLFELKCRVLNGEPDCSIPENPRNTWGSSFQCSRGTLCFIVATRGATNVVFSTSALLEAHIDARTLRATISTVVLPTGATHRLDVYEISAVRGFPQFQKRRDLEVCFDTVPAGAGKRCVQLHFMVPPFDLRMSVDEGPFLTSAVAISRPYERRRVRVQVRDLNLEDHVCIDYPAVTNGVVSNVPNSLNQLAMESQATAFFEWEDMPTLTSSWTYSLSDCFAATRCVGGKLGGVCPGGLWERAFTVKGKSMNATMVFGAHSESKNVRSRSTYTLMLPDYATDSAQLIVASQLGVPAFLDSMNLAIDQALKRGTPYSLQRLEPAFINCPLSTVAVYAILQKWRRNNDGNKFSKVLCHSF